MKKEISGLQIWKGKPFVILTALFALLFLALVIKIAMPNQIYQFEGSTYLEPGSLVGEHVVYEGIPLPMGSYRVELAYHVNKDLANWCNVKDGTVFTGALLCNGEHLYSALDNTGYDMWLYEGTDNLQVVVEYGGSGVLQTGNLRIVETNQLWTMLLTSVFFAACVAYAVLIFYYYDREYTVDAKKKNTFFFVMLIAFVASLPYLNGFNITGADLTYHLQRIEGVKDGLLTGQFPVRLEPKWLYNHGYANGIFYCNTFLYFPAILRILGFTITASYNIYCIALTIATAWIAYYCFSKIFRSSSIGIVSCALYTLSIFRIYKLVITTAVGEGSAVAFIPLVFYGLYRVFAEDPKDSKYKTCWIPLMLGYAGLIQTHVLTCEITAFVTIVFCLLNIRKFMYKNVWFEFIKGAIGAAALSLWYLVPFLDYYLTQDVHIKHVSARTIQDRGLLWAQLAFHFWRDGSNAPDGVSGMQNSHPVGIGFVLVVALGIFLVLWFSGVFRKDANEQTRFVKQTAAVGTMLLIMSTSAFPWDHIQSLHPIAASLVSSLQFPNRFLGWGTMCLVVAFGYLLKHFRKNQRKFYWGMVALAIFGVTTSGMYLLDFVKANQNYYELYNEESMGFGYISGAEYLIEGTDETKLTFAKAKTSTGVEISEYTKSGLRAEFYCVNATDVAGHADLPMLMYKGYRAYNADTRQELQLNQGENYTIQLEVPAGYEGNVIVKFVSPFYWRISEGVTALAVVVLLIMWGRYQRKKYVERKVQ